MVVDVKRRRRRRRRRRLAFDDGVFVCGISSPKSFKKKGGKTCQTKTHIGKRPKTICL